MAPRLSALWMLSSLAAWAAAPAITMTAPSDGYLTYVGTASAQHSAKVLYREHHVLRIRDGRIAERVVLYTCSDGAAAFARKEVWYVDPTAPDFALEDPSNGMREGIRSSSSGRVVFFASHTEAEKIAALPRVAGLVADAGFDEFVRMHWDDLMAGRSLALRFLVPSRLADFAFRVQHLRADRIDGAPVEVFRLKLAGIRGWIIPGIDVFYGTGDRTLRRYEGLSDLRDAANDNFQTQIDFPTGERRRSDAEALRRVRQVPLAPCT